MSQMRTTLKSHVSSLLILFFSVLQLSSCATTGSRVVSISQVDFKGQAVITGYVRDAETKEVLPGAVVSIPSISMEVMTDNSGLYRLNRVPPRVYTIRAAVVGYPAEEYKGLTIGRDSLINLDFYLQGSYMESPLIE